MRFFAYLLQLTLVPLNALEFRPLQQTNERSQAWIRALSAVLHDAFVWFTFNRMNDRNEMSLVHFIVPIACGRVKNSDSWLSPTPYRCRASVRYLCLRCTCCCRCRCCCCCCCRRSCTTFLLPVARRITDVLTEQREACSLVRERCGTGRDCAIVPACCPQGVDRLPDGERLQFVADRKTERPVGRRAQMLPSVSRSAAGRSSVG